jgi:hypothetical protein
MLREREKIMFPESFRNQERLIEVKFGEQLERQRKQGFNRYSGSSTRVPRPVTDMIIGIIITFLAIAAFLLIFGFIGFTVIH